MAVLYVLSAIIAALLGSQALNAQPVLTFKRIEVRYPEITLAYKVTCAGTFRRDLGSQHFEVRENGIRVKDVVVWCPPDDSCCISACLVLDRTGSMQGQKIASVKAAATKFVTLMDPCDEAELISFNTVVTLNLPMTNDKPRLISAIESLTAVGNTALWDAAYEGISELAANGRNACRAVILLTDGGENSSKYHSFADVVRLISDTRVRVFTIGYGIDPGSRQEGPLRQLAEISGGQYYHAPLPEDLEAIFTAIRQDIKNAYQECYLKYTTNCPDGSLRVVNLTLVNYCGGSETATRTYQAPLDRSKFQEVRVRLGTASVMGTQEALIPLILETPVNAVFSKGNLTVIYDRSLAVLTGVSTNGTLLEGVGTTVSDIGSGHTIWLRDHKEISGSGVLMYLRFRTADVAFTAQSFLHISNWSMDAYCLIPRPEDGSLSIRPREPLLECEVVLPERLAWDDDLKDYTPNPFTATVLVRNTGTREAYRGRARISVTSKKLSLSSPVVTEQSLTPATVMPGKESVASWDIRTAALDNADSMTICFTVTSDNHPPIECCRTLYVNPAQTSALVCALETPDTISFREQYYEPEEFDIRIIAINTGTGRTKNVIGQMLQDSRFTILSPAALTLADVLYPGDTASGIIRVRMHPRVEDGFDTVRVHLQGNDTDPVWCERAIWVERIRAPRFELSCSTPDDKLVFSDEILDYVPNPFPVTTTAVNVGETYAEECRLVFVGPPRFTPIDGNLRPAGTIPVNGKHTERWTLRALPRSEAGWDTLIFQVQGRGGLGRTIVLADCRLPVFVPAIRRPEYKLTCTAPDSLIYMSNGYVPDPFPFTVRLANTGTASGRRIRLTPAIPPGVLLAAGEPTERTVDVLAPGDTATFRWMLRPVERTTSSTLQICLSAIDSIGASDECCSEVFIPQEASPRLDLTCLTVDTLFIDTGTGLYAGNPFPVYATIANTGRGKAENVHATLYVLGPAVRIIGTAEQSVGDIEPGGHALLTWTVDAQTRNTETLLPLRITAEAGNHQQLNCTRMVYLPALRFPRLTAECRSDPEDSLLFDWESGSYAPAFVTVTLRVKNTGDFSANDVSAIIAIPPGIMLAPGESMLKSLQPSTLEPATSGIVSWKVIPERRTEDAVRTFLFTARAANAEDAMCSDPLFIQGAPKKLTLSLPRGVLLRYGDKRTIAVCVSRTVAAELSMYRFDVSFDPGILSILQANSTGTLTERGWVGPVLVSPTPGHVRVSDYTTTTPIHAEEGVLVSLLVEGTYNGPGMSYAHTELKFVPGSVDLDRGEILAETSDGDAYVTNDCLEPLAASDRFTLAQNIPNPCSGETVIVFSVSEPTHARLVIFDRMGRVIAVPHAGETAKGTHAVRFDASILEPGLYFYRLETPEHIAVRKLSRR
ncbi:MAG: VWA domain-containing protein [Bacteroidota bacterium]|nr:VWA domain-containing protein [Bacteroidota bacterium]